MWLCTELYQAGTLDTQHHNERGVLNSRVWFYIQRSDVIFGQHFMLIPFTCTYKYFDVCVTVCVSVCLCAHVHALCTGGVHSSHTFELPVSAQFVVAVSSSFDYRWQQTHHLYNCKCHVTHRRMVICTGISKSLKSNHIISHPLTRQYITDDHLCVWEYTQLTNSPIDC